jgi:hypothetical protein
LVETIYDDSYALLKFSDKWEKYPELAAKIGYDIDKISTANNFFFLEQAWVSAICVSFTGLFVTPVSTNLFKHFT